MRFRAAIVRPPGATFAAGLTTAGLGAPDLARARAQHEAVVEALERAGLEVTRLAPDDARPDATFVEDAAVITARGAVLTRPGAPSRRDEPEGVRDAVSALAGPPRAIAAPGTLDGGDVLEAGDRFFIGLSARTNEAGAAQLGTILAGWGYAVTTVDLRARAGLLHLKSGVAAIDERLLVLDPALAEDDAFRGIARIVVPAGERYAANCVRVNDVMLIADGFPEVRRAIAARGIPVVALDVSEFRKMDGGLSCLSLRVPERPEP
ncbi:MAG: dimethylarginine dimethylaminohydrolase family protein [Hyphomicrobiales bacterium]